MSHRRDLALRARSFFRPPTHKLKRLNPDLGYWGGVTYVFMGRQQTIGSITSHEYDITPGEDSEMELMWGYIQPESSAVNCFVTIQDALDGGDLIGTLMGFNAVAAGVRAVFPDRFSYASAAQPQIGYGGTPIILSGDMFLHAEANASPNSERSRCVVVARVRGDKPTAAMSGGLTEQSLIHDEFFG